MDTIIPIDTKFGTYNKLHLYFQLGETTWCLSGFHGNDSQISLVIGGRHLGFLIELSWNSQKSMMKLSVFSKFLPKSLYIEVNTQIA